MTAITVCMAVLAVGARPAEEATADYEWVQVRGHATFAPRDGAGAYLAVIAEMLVLVVAATAHGDPAPGDKRWEFNTGTPVRASPAAAGNLFGFVAE